MRTEGHAGLLVDTREQVLDPFIRRGARKRPSSHMGQHLRAAIVVCNGHPEIADSQRCHTAQNRINNRERHQTGWAPSLALCLPLRRRK